MEVAQTQDASINSLVIQWSFLITLFLLFGSAFITGLECINSRFDDQKRDPSIVSALQVETAVSAIAGFVYYYIWSESVKGNLKNVMNYRYIDWFVTTPLMLFSFTLFSESNIRENGIQTEQYSIKYIWLPLLILANWVMIVTGFVSERTRIGVAKWGKLPIAMYVTAILAFGAVIVGLYFINEQSIMLYDQFDDSRDNTTNLSFWVFIVFAVVWGLYGVFGAFRDGTVVKIIGYNALDCVSKVFFGLFLWFKMRGIKNKIEFLKPASS